VRLLLDRVEGERFPNPDHLDRIEASLSTVEQLSDYVEVLLEKAANVKRPSPAILDRIQGLAALQQNALKRA
jgi:hypothetical protein